MPSKRRADARPRKTDPAKVTPETARALERRVKRLERELAEARAAHERRVELVRRAANRRLSAMMKELATLRHHEARADALERLLASHTRSAPTEGKSDGEDPRLPG